MENEKALKTLKGYMEILLVETELHETSYIIDFEFRKCKKECKEETLFIKSISKSGNNDNDNRWSCTKCGCYE